MKKKICYKLEKEVKKKNSIDFEKNIEILKGSYQNDRRILVETKLKKKFQSLYLPTCVSMEGADEPLFPL